MIPFEQLPVVWLAAFGVDAVRYLVGAGLVAFVLGVAVRRWASRFRIQTRSATAADRARELGFSMLTVTVYACVGLAVINLQIAGYLRIYTDLSAWPLAWTILGLPLLLVLHDAYFYWMHRLMHHRWLFRHFHRIHHRSRTPTPWAAYAFAPGEALLMTAFVPLVTLLIPIHELVLFVFLALMILRNAMGHSGIEFHPTWWIDSPLDALTTMTHHDLHHQRVNGNYGLYFTWWDRLMGTEFGDYRGAFRTAATGSGAVPQLLVGLLAGWLAIAAPASRAEPEADAILGQWVMQDGSALLAVEHDQIGYRVRILSLLESEFVPSDGDVRGRRRDRHNPQPELRDRNLEGIEIASSLDFNDGGWEGHIYDPGSGNRYRCRISLDGDFLRVHGYVGVAALGRTLYWQRADRYAAKVERMLSAVGPSIAAH